MCFNNKKQQKYLKIYIKYDYYILDEEEVIKKMLVIFIGFLIFVKKNKYLENLLKYFLFF